VVFGEMSLELQRIMHHHDRAFLPLEDQRWILKRETMPRYGLVQTVSLLIIIAEYPIQRHRQLGEYVQSLGLRDVTGVNDPVNLRGVEQFNNALNVLQIVVGITDNADLHGFKIAGSEKKTPGQRPGEFSFA
jgi:hypothetical protein